MKINRSRRWALCIAMAIVAVGSLSLAAGASAKLVGAYAKFQNCPFANLEVKKCMFSVTESGEFVLGNKKVPVEKPVTLQGGILAPVEGVSGFVAATNGVTLSKAPQAIPGGLSGLVNCKEISEPFLRFSCELTFENGLTGASSTLELAKPASEIRVNEGALARGEGVALKMPVKVHLENPFLGSKCYVGSSSSPITLELTSGVTSPPEPNKPIEGNTGLITFQEGGRILHIEGDSLVDNAWSAPGATGCGGFLVELLLDPIIDVSAGVPSAAGHNTAILNNTIDIGNAVAVRKNDAENP